MHRQETGFTLIELMVVLAILSLIIGLVIPNFFGITGDTKCQMIVGEHQKMREAIYDYYTDTGEWPYEWSNYPAGNTSKHQLWGDGGFVGWDGPYLDRPILQDHDWGGDWGIKNDQTLTGLGRYTCLMYQGIPDDVARCVDETMDDGSADSGLVQWDNGCDNARTLVMGVSQVENGPTAGSSKGDSWPFTASGDILSSTAGGCDWTIYVGSQYGHLHAINPDGTQKWALDLGDEVESSPAVGSDGTVYVGSMGTSDNFLAISPDKTIKWSKSLGVNGVHSSPAIGTDGTVYIGANDDSGDNFYAINPSTGSVKWSHDIGDNIGSSPAIASDGTVYIGSDNDYLYAYNPDGTQKWSIDLGHDVFSPAIGPDGTIYVGVDRDEFYAVTPSGATKWPSPFNTSWVVSTSPAIGPDGTIYVGDSDNYLYAITDNGSGVAPSEKWRFDAQNEVHSSPAVGYDGTIYVGSDHGSVYAIDPDGTQKWESSTGAAVQSSPAIGWSNNTLYIGSNDNNLYALNIDSDGVADSSWPMFRSDYRHQGQVQ
ncbi:MAG: PQQ-binding-like beta-propeller repeat protein [Chloroflexota bacterium]